MPGVPSLPSVIEVVDLTYRYGGSPRTAVRQLSFQVRPGEIFGLLGPSGAGKSTTQKILIGLLRGYQGRVSVLGQELAFGNSDYYERIGVSFETPTHFLKLTALENLTYFGALYAKPKLPPSKLLQWVDLQEAANQPVGQYSKGMKVRLSVARSLVNDPDLLFLDEPTAGLDPVNSRRIENLILEQQRLGKTIFLTTHDMRTAEKLCNRLAFVVDGEISSIDAPRTLKLRYGRPRVRVEVRHKGQFETREFPLDGLADDDIFLSLLRTGSVETIHTLEATLEDVFIEVTGRSLL